MKTIHCTKKLLKELKDDTLFVLPNVKNMDNSGLGNWHCNIFRYKRRKCLIFTNEKNLYTFFVFGVIKENLLNFSVLFLKKLIENLTFEGIESGVIKKIISGYNQIGISKTFNRSVLGSMNDLKYHFEFLADREGSVEGAHLLKINQKINRIPMGALKYAYPIEELKILLAKY